MRILLDTHTFLWWITDSRRLSQRARHMMGEGGNDLFWSAASSWEVAITYHLGKLPLSEVPEVFIPLHLRQNRIESLPIQNEHAFLAGQLPEHHRDPFDRMLIAQAQLEKMPIITSDEHLGLYNIDIIW